jgi:hypothetical protein
MASPAQHHHNATDERPEVLNPVEARQGFLDRPVLAILVASTALVVLGFAGVFLGFW